MKKNLLSMFAMATMLLATGCSQEEEPIANNSNDYVDASFTVELSGAVQSRGLGEADLVDQLYYGIYQNGNVVPIIKNVDDASGNFYVVNVGEADVENRTATVKMRLVKGQTYDFVFWAQVKGNKHYNINMDDLQNITVNYNGDANDETRDAFFAKELGYKVESHFTKTIVLKRPFAQLNVGTTKADFAAAKILLGEQPITQSRLVVKKIPTSLNLLTGKVGEDDHTADAEFKMAFLPKADASTQNDYDILRADVNGDKSYSIDEEFAHLSMNYLLAAERGESELYEVDVEFANAKGSINTINVAQLPVYRNYRTNIIGNVLTTNGEFTIIIDQNFEKEEIIRELWDGESTEAVTPIQENGVDVYQIANAKQLAWVAEQVNSGANTFKGAIVRLTDHIYLNNQPWTPIGLGDGGNVNAGTDDGKAFQGTFEGKDFTIYELNIVAQTASRSLTEGDQLPAGLFGKLNGGTIKDFTVDGANVKHVVAENGGGIAVVAGIIFNTGTIENVTVKNAVVEGNRCVAGIAGFVYGSIKNCKVENVKLTATPDNLTGEYDNGDKVGGIAGNFFVDNGNELSDNTAINVTITGYRDLGGIAGAADAKAVKGNTVTGVVVTVDRTDSEKDYNSSKPTNAGAIVGSYLGNSSEADLTTNGNTSTETTVVGNTDSESAVVTSQAEFQEAIKNGATEIAVAGEVALTGVSGKELTIVGVGEDAVVDRSGTPNMGGSTLKFKNITIKGTSANYQGLQHIAEEYYTDCTIDNQIFLYGKAHFVNCTFNQTDAELYNVWTYCSNEVIFENCTFNSAGKSVLVYNEGACGTNATFIDCTFKASQPVEGKAAIEIDGTLLKNTDMHVITINNATVTGFGKGSVSGNSLWNDKKADRSIINEDGKVYAYADIPEVLNTAMTMDAKTISAVVTDYIDWNLTTGLGGASTETISISGIEGDTKAKLNITCASASYNGSYVTYRTINPNAVMNFKNLTLEKSNWTATTWNTYNMEFYTDVNIEDCVIEHPITICTNAEIKNTTIDSSADTSNTFYSIWMTPGTNATLSNCVVKGNRGIKIDQQYDSNPTLGKLSVTDTRFETTGSKAAILVMSKAGADITLNNVNIESVAADTEYAVWVDEDAAAYADLVRVVGGKKKIEGQIADGVSLSGKVYSISNANGMFWFANEVNVNNKDFSGETVKLVANIDLQNRDWQPIGQTGATEFKGIFDGQNKIISNLSVDSEAETGNHYSSALFGWLEGNGSGDDKTIKVMNVTINVAKIVGHHNCGALVGYMEGNVKVDNCHVENAEVSCTVANSEANGDKAGALIGNGNSEPKLSNCTAKNSSVSAGRDAGQVVGAAKTANVTGCSASNVTVTNNGTGTGANINESVIGRLL
ncbi:MAG: hypothetical protein E7096_04585 [Bacteroides sp.]|nr:hypothetical protein [Bacteroides sp.]